MIRFNCDYSEGAHERILTLLTQTNLEQTPGYGEDAYCREAADIIRRLCDLDDADVHLMVGGTQANLTVIAAGLRPHQCVLSAETGHISVHETGAIEACGHKVVALPAQDGKLTAEQVLNAHRLHIEDEAFEHMPQPRMVYISNPTELGTIYRRAELEALSAACRQSDMLLFMDGARLGYGLSAPDNDLDLPAIARCCDAFTIGLTKVGALFGEGVVLTHPLLKSDFRYIMKQKGGMLAKGRLLGLQFIAMLEDGLYFELGKNAVGQAMRIREAFLAKGFPLLVDSTTNQQFVILPRAAQDGLARNYSFFRVQGIDEDRSAFRFCTSWATRPEDVDALVRDIGAL